jgi:hypothetical protein
MYHIDVHILRKPYTSFVSVSRLMPASRSGASRLAQADACYAKEAAGVFETRFPSCRREATARAPQVSSACSDTSGWQGYCSSTIQHDSLYGHCGYTTVYKDER